MKEHKTRKHFAGVPAKASQFSSKTKKGQYFSFDAIVASVIFIITFIALLSYWFSVKSSLDSKEDEISREAARVSDAMFTPAYLYTSYSIEKVNESALTSLFGSNLQASFNTPYRVYAVVTKASGAQFSTHGGTAPPPNVRNVAKVRRVFILYNSTEESEATMDLYLYSNS